jgi:hypothetical protein
MMEDRYLGTNCCDKIKSNPIRLIIIIIIIADVGIILTLWIFII